MKLYMNVSDSNHPKGHKPQKLKSLKTLPSPRANKQNSKSHLENKGKSEYTTTDKSFTFRKSSFTSPLNMKKSPAASSSGVKSFTSDEKTSNTSSSTVSSSLSSPVSRTKLDFESPITPFPIESDRQVRKKKRKRKENAKLRQSLGLDIDMAWSDADTSDSDGGRRVKRLRKSSSMHRFATEDVPDSHEKIEKKKKKERIPIISPIPDYSSFLSVDVNVEEREPPSLSPQFPFLSPYIGSLSGKAADRGATFNRKPAKVSFIDLDTENSDSEIFGKVTYKELEMKKQKKNHKVSEKGGKNFTKLKLKNKSSLEIVRSESLDIPAAQDDVPFTKAPSDIISIVKGKASRDSSSSSEDTRFNSLGWVMASQRKNSDSEETDSKNSISYEEFLADVIRNNCKNSEKENKLKLTKPTKKKGIPSVSGQTTLMQWLNKSSDRSSTEDSEIESTKCEEAESEQTSCECERSKLLRVCHKGKWCTVQQEEHRMKRRRETSKILKAVLLRSKENNFRKHRKMLYRSPFVVMKKLDISKLSGKRVLYKSKFKKSRHVSGGGFSPRVPKHVVKNGVHCSVDALGCKAETNSNTVKMVHVKKSTKKKPMKLDISKLFGKHVSHKSKFKKSRHVSGGFSPRVPKHVVKDDVHCSVDTLGHKAETNSNTVKVVYVPKPTEKKSTEVVYVQKPTEKKSTSQTMEDKQMSHHSEKTRNHSEKRRNSKKATHHSKKLNHHSEGTSHNSVKMSHDLRCPSPLLPLVPQPNPWAVQNADPDPQKPAVTETEQYVILRPLLEGNQSTDVKARMFALTPVVIKDAKNNSGSSETSTGFGDNHKSPNSVPAKVILLEGKSGQKDNKKQPQFSAWQPWRDEVVTSVGNTVTTLKLKKKSLQESIRVKRRSLQEMKVLGRERNAIESSTEKAGKLLDTINQAKELLGTSENRENMTRSMSGVEVYKPVRSSTIISQISNMHENLSTGNAAVEERKENLENVVPANTYSYNVKGKTEDSCTEKVTNSSEGAMNTSTDCEVARCSIGTNTDLDLEQSVSDIDLCGSDESEHSVSDIDLLDCDTDPYDGDADLFDEDTDLCDYIESADETEEIQELQMPVGSNV